MMPGRRAFLSMAQAAGLAAALPRAVHAQAAFPSKPVHLIVPYAPGGSADVLSRIVAQHLSQQWGQPVLVETRPGGGTIIGSSLVAKSPADGYTILFISNSFVINAKLRSDLPYDGLKAFVPVANMVNSPQVVAVNSASPYHTFKEWVAAAKARPGTLSIGTLGPATTQHIAAEMLQRATGTQLIYTAFTGGAPAVNAALGGHIDTVLANLSELSAQIEAWKLRPLAVTTQERLDAIRQVPTVAELGYPGYEAVAWFGYAAPAGTPQEIVNKFAEGVRAALGDADVRQRVTTLGLQPAYMDPKAFAAHIGEQYAKYSRVIDDSQIKAE
jgi:tripartite-type tricarboxylate transporter receptor subunit TctC